MQSLRHGILLLATLFTASLAGAIWENHATAVGFPWWLLDPVEISAVLAAGWRYGFLVVAILGAHELGHYFACRYYGVSATLPFFIPGVAMIGTFGAVIRIRSRIPHRKALFDIAVAGPIAGFAVALPVAVFGLAQAAAAGPAPNWEGGAPSMMLGEPVLFGWIRIAIGAPNGVLTDSWIGAAWVGMLVTALNLFPVGQLDGGHTVFAISPRLHRWLSWVTIVGLAAMMVWQLWHGRLPAYPVWWVVLLWMRDRHPPVLNGFDGVGAARKWIAVGLLLMFYLTFVPLPFILG